MKSGPVRCRPRDARRRGAWLALVAAAALQAPGAAGTEPERLAELLRHDCGSCHGLRLTGGLGPALTPVALAGRPDASLRATILDGRPGTAMPSWRGLLSEADAEWLVRRLREGARDAH